MTRGTSRRSHNYPPPTVFIGCSSAALPHVRVIQEKIKACGKIDCKVWDNMFHPGNDVLDDLLLYVNLFDFAVLVLSADDFISINREGETKPSPRDNVIFELGLFMGVRGRRHVFAFVMAQDETALKIPSDLAGNTMVVIDPAKIKKDEYLTEKIGRICEAIASEAEGAALSLLPSAALAQGYFNNFLVPVHAHLHDKEEVVIGDKTYQIRDCELVILLPRSLRQASVENRDDYVRNHGLLSYNFTVGKRNYATFVYPPQPGEAVRFVDCPTTLLSSAETIDIFLQQSRQVSPSRRTRNIKEQMEKQELSNFHKALHYLVKSKIWLEERTKYKYFRRVAVKRR